MKTYNVKVTQPLIGYYYGWLTFEAENQTDAMERLDKMSEEEIDEKVNWIPNEETDELEEGEIIIQIDTLEEL